jgi:hypothetical protein
MMPPYLREAARALSIRIPDSHSIFTAQPHKTGYGVLVSANRRSLGRMHELLSHPGPNILEGNLQDSTDDKPKIEEPTDEDIVEIQLKADELFEHLRMLLELDVNEPKFKINPKKLH